MIIHRQTTDSQAVMERKHRNNAERRHHEQKENVSPVQGIEPWAPRLRISQLS